MPEKIELADGTEREVPTDEELKNLQAGHDANIGKRDAVKEYNALTESLELKEGETLQNRIDSMKEEANPNFAKLRTKMKALEASAKANNIELDEEGNVKEENKSLTEDDVDALIEKKSLQKEADAFKTNALKGFDKNDSKTIGEVFNRLNSVGGTLAENMQLAVDKVLPGQSGNALNQAINNGGGGGPKPAKAGEASPELKEFGAKFGITDEDFKNAA